MPMTVTLDGPDTIKLCIPRNLTCKNFTTFSMHQPLNSTAGNFVPPTTPIASRSVVISVMRFRLPTTRSGLTCTTIQISGIPGAGMSAPLNRSTLRRSSPRHRSTSACWHAKVRHFASGNTAHPPAGNSHSSPTSQRMTASSGWHTTGILRINAG